MIRCNKEDELDSQPTVQVVDFNYRHPINHSKCKQTALVVSDDTSKFSDAMKLGMVTILTAK